MANNDSKIKLKAFKPEEEILNKFSTKDKWQLTYVIAGNIAFIVAFLLLGSLMLFQKYYPVGILSILTCLCFIASLILIKIGKIYEGDFITTIGILFAILIILFFTEKIVTTSLVFYRNAFFIVVMAICNELIALKKRQLAIFSGVSAILWIVDCIVEAPAHVSHNLMGFISAVIVCSLAIILSDLIISLMSKFNSKIIQKAEEAKSEAENHLSQITNVVEESKNGLQVGKRLYEATQTASSSLTELNAIYAGISDEATGLSEETLTIRESSSQVKEQAKQMKVSVEQQNDSITETSREMAEISESLSTMSEIADKRRSNMSQVVKSLDDQMRLIRKLVDEVNEVQESSNGIAFFIQTVNKIASQTGLLAMNASIEAAHAGETGKGFSVIAQEIRKLSEQTTANAARISDELEKNAEVVKSTTESVAGFEKFTLNTTEELKSTITAMEEILAGISEMNKATGEIMNSLEEIVEQSHSTGKIVDNVVTEFDRQDLALEKITNFAQKLHENVDFMDSQLNNIKTVVSSIETESTENVEFTKKLTGTLNINV